MAEGRSSTVLSDVTWFAQPILTACAATAWSFTNALRIDVRDKGIQVLTLHVGFVDTELTRGFDVKKSDPRVVAARTSWAASLAAGAPPGSTTCGAITAWCGGSRSGSVF